MNPDFRRLRRLAVILLIVLSAASLHAQKKPKKAAAPKSGPATLSVVDTIVKKAIADQQVPGAVVVIGHNGRVVYRKAFGMRSLEPRREPMTLDTIFDMASLTKCMATATSVMRLVEYGQVRLNDPVAKYLSEFGKNGKEEITVRQLLTHYSGLRPDLDLKQPWSGADTAFRMIMDEKPVNPPGARFLYSDINYETLGFLVERVSSLPVDKYAQVHIFEPLKMARTRFVPPESWLKKIAPTEFDERGVMLRGVVHDPTARRMGGVAGHAGVFSTAGDVAKFAQAFLDRKTILSPLSIEKMTTPEQPPNATAVRGFGWDLDTPFSSNRGDFLPVGSYGHTGFTGTSLWIDPTTNTYIIILTNSVHPRNKGGGAVSLRSKIATAVAAALKLTPSEEARRRLLSMTGYNEAAAAQRHIAARNGKVKVGIDVLEQRNFDLFQNGRKRRIGVVTNQTGLDSQGRRTIDALKSAPNVDLVAIFSPEHGVTGKLDTTTVGNTVDAATGVPVYNVYGDTDAKRRPPLEILKTLDAVIYDIQDAGVRFYTYETTLGYFLEAAAQAGIEMIVLDRPDPITGSFVQGPVSDPGKESFVNYTSEPVRQGMTVGELAKMFNAERHINARLTVIPMEGWLRGDWFDSTGLLWTMPSPNLRTLNAATLYPGVAVVEGTNVSVGRGTDAPFELLGAPWIKPVELADYLNARLIQGVRFVPTTFTPTAAKYADQPLGGIYMVVTDRNTLDAPEMGVEIASALHQLYPNEFQMDQMIFLLINQAAFVALKAGEDPRRIAQDWQDALEKFKEVRKKYLIY
jgi:uncharacterized protein YbbC (DUF1343 family)